ncbi:MAG: hypothetical protein KGN79_08845 [Acidobacteriota bacterium]|nr:hypothetical protein [Acidobacteriota bacterium]
MRACDAITRIIPTFDGRPPDGLVELARLMEIYGKQECKSERTGEKKQDNGEVGNGSQDLFSMAGRVGLGIPRLPFRGQGQAVECDDRRYGVRNDHVPRQEQIDGPSQEDGCQEKRENPDSGISPGGRPKGCDRLR